LGSLEPRAVVFDDLRLEGRRLPAGLAAGAAAPVDLRWRVERGGSKRFSLLVVLRDGDGVEWARDERSGLVYGGWQDGDTFLSRHRLAPPPGAPPGAHRLGPSAPPARGGEPRGARPPPRRPHGPPPRLRRPPPPPAPPRPPAPRA